jgi:hypothetical protein
MHACCLTTHPSDKQVTAYIQPGAKHNAWQLVLHLALHESRHVVWSWSLSSVIGCFTPQLLYVPRRVTCRSPQTSDSVVSTFGVGLPEAAVGSLIWPVMLQVLLMV